MRIRLLQNTFLLMAACCLTVSADEDQTNTGWRQFRGPGGQSAAGDSLPKELEKSLAWKVDLPGQGVSSPIVVGDQVIITASGGMEERTLFVASYDVETGKQRWLRSFWATGRPFCHPDSANAAPTPCSDGELIFAFYSSNDVACFDLDGNMRWYRGLASDYPRAGNDVGMSSSPVMTTDAVVCLVENQGDSFLIALDRNTGETKWRHVRPKQENWASPSFVPANDQRPAQVIVHSHDGSSGIDAETGETLWSLEGKGDIISSAIVTDDLIFVPMDGISALRFGGDDEPELAWGSDKIRPASASAVIADGKLLTLNRAGVLLASDASSGEELWKNRVGGSYWATPVVSGKLMYFFASGGDARIVDLEAEGKVISEYDLEASIYGSPAVGGQAVFVRSDDHLWKFGA